MKTPEQRREEFNENDRANGGYIIDQYKQIKNVLETQDMKWVKERFRDLKAHAIAHTDFYASYSPDDEFPVVNKSDILENYDQHKAKGGFMEPVHISSTSGSTGIPFSVIQDMKKRKRTIADLHVFGERGDYPTHERMVFIRVLSAKLHRTPEQEDRENIYYVDSSDLSHDSIGRMVDTLIEKKPRTLLSMPTTLVEISKYVIMHNISSDVFTMKSVITTGEGLSDDNRRLLMKAFGCKVYRRYADMELGIMAQDMGDGGKYYLNWGSFYFECLKTDRDEPAEKGEVGRIVVTDLFNYALPMIRYDTGDLGIMEQANENSLPYLKDIYGRKRDCIYTTDGKLISPAKVFVLMWGIEGVKQWQFIQKTQFNYVFKVNAEKDADLTPAIDRLRNLLGDDAIIDIELVDEIPVLSSNKRIAVKCEWKKPE